MPGPSRRLKQCLVAVFSAHRPSPGLNRNRRPLQRCAAGGGARTAVAGFLSALVISLLAAQAGASGTLSASTALSQEGFLSLSWEVPSLDKSDVLQVSIDAGFGDLVRVVPLNIQVIEKAQIHISGLADGVYYARLASGEGRPLSDVARFEVRHRELGTALLIFFVGAALFIALIVVVLRFAATEQ